MCCSGSEIAEITVWSSHTEMPFRSRVFLDCKSLVASIISVPVTGESLNLNKGTVSCKSCVKYGQSVIWFKPKLSFIFLAVLAVTM